LKRDLSRKVEGHNGYEQSPPWQSIKRTSCTNTAIITFPQGCLWHKLAHQLCDECAVMHFEDLNLNGMKAPWGRKVSDLGFAQFRISWNEWLLSAAKQWSRSTVLRQRLRCVPAADENIISL
jgi:hypothetical protein